MSGFSHVRRLVVEWGHCDPAGIVFNPRFFEWFDHSTALLLEAALGARKAALVAQFGIVGIPLVQTGAKFLAPARFGDEVEITSTVLRVGRSSFSVQHVLRQGDSVAVEAEETRVWAGGAGGGLRAVEIPELVRQRLLPG